MKNASLVSLVAVLVMASVASSATVWDPAFNGIFPPDTGNWNDPVNWTNGLPNDVEKAVFNVFEAAEAVVTDEQSLIQLVQGDGADGGVLRVQDGGSLSTDPVWSAVGYNANAHMIVETGGVVNFGEHMWVGFLPDAEGTVDINGGTVTVAEMFGLGWNGGTGFVNVHDGLLALSNIHGDGSTSIQGDSVLDIELGSVTLDNNRTSTIEQYIAAGGITAYGGAGTVLIDVAYDDSLQMDVTTLTATLQVAVNGDYNGSGQVEQGDLDLVLLNWGSEIPPDTVPDGWINQPPTDDGKIDQNDLDGVLLNWGDTAVASATASAVPEPGTMSLVLASVCVLLGLGRRRGA